MCEWTVDPIATKLCADAGQASSRSGMRKDLPRVRTFPEDLASEGFTELYADDDTSFRHSTSRGHSLPPSSEILAGDPGHLQAPHFHTTQSLVSDLSPRVQRSPEVPVAVPPRSSGVAQPKSVTFQDHGTPSRSRVPRVSLTKTDQQLWRAAGAGDVTGMREVFGGLGSQQPALLGSLFLHSRTVLHAAASAGQADAVGMLLNIGADVDAQSDAGCTALHEACEHGFAAVAARLLLDGRANPLLETAEGNLAIHLAASNGHAATVLKLMESGSAQIHARNRMGQRPGDMAVDEDTLAIFRQFPATPQVDTYVGRSYHAGVVRRNSRFDHVRRLLHAQTQIQESPDDGSSDRGRSSTVERKPIGIESDMGQSRKHGHFAQVKQTEFVAERVGPGSFSYIDRIGGGAFGEVFLVKHNTTGEAYAMKVLKRTGMRQLQLRYATSERNVMSYLHHPYIVQLFYAFQTDTRLVLVMQYCSGGDLQGLIKREKKLQTPEARLYTAEVLLALEHIHAREIVYRDLKPENVLLDGNGHALLTDFGLAKENVRFVRTKSFVGSPAFMAPELLLPDHAHDRMVDVYGLGVLLHCMAVGLPPYFSECRETLLENIGSAPLLLPDTLDPDVQAVIRDLLRREPSQRLGAQQTEDVRGHRFFEALCWEMLLRREVPVPKAPSKPGLQDEHQEDKPFSTSEIRNEEDEADESDEEFSRAVPGWNFVAPATRGGA